VVAIDRERLAGRAGILPRSEALPDAVRRTDLVPPGRAAATGEEV